MDNFLTEIGRVMVRSVGISVGISMEIGVVRDNFRQIKQKDVSHEARPRILIFKRDIQIVRFHDAGREEVVRTLVESSC